MTFARLGVLIAGACAASAAVTVAQQPQFTSRADLVLVDVLVTDRGQPVRGLTREQFEIRDNGVQQSIDLLSVDERPINVVLTLDLSRSVEGDRLRALRDAIEAALSTVKPGDRAALLAFNHRVALDAPLSTNVTQIRDALHRAIPAGSTALVDGTFAALTLGEREDGRTLALVFSDGVDTASWLTPDLVIAAAKRSNTVVYGIDAGRRASEFLGAIAAATGGRVVRASTASDLRTQFLEIVAEFRFRYLLGYTPRGVDRTGWHALDVRLHGASGRVRARPGYQVSR